VTEKFQKESPGEWIHRTEEIQDKRLDYHIASAYWQDLTGKVLVAMMLQAEKINEDIDWTITDWQVTGIVFARSYAEPRPTPVSESEDAGSDLLTDEYTPGIQSDIISREDP